MSSRSVTQALIAIGVLVHRHGPRAPGSRRRPPTPEVPAEQTIFDTAGLLDAGTIRTATLVAEPGRGGDRAAHDQSMRSAPTTRAVAGSVGRARSVAVDGSRRRSGPARRTGSVRRAVHHRLRGISRVHGVRPGDALDRIMVDSVHPLLEAGDLNSATIVATARTLMEVRASSPAVPPPTRMRPPMRRRRDRRSRTRDRPSRLRLRRRLPPETIATVEATIDRIEQRTGAEVVVYTQDADSPVDRGDRAEGARARSTSGASAAKGFDDGLVIFFDFEPGARAARSSSTRRPGSRPRS